MSIEILDSDAAIAQKIKAAIFKETKKPKFITKLQRMAEKIREFLVKKIVASEVFESLAGGILRAEFGLDDYEVSNLHNLVEDMITINVYHESKGGSFKITIHLINDNFDLNTQGAYTYTNKKGETYTIHWLYWLLMKDEAEVVPDHVIYLKPGLGRSEMAIMIKPKEGGSYSVDGYYSGNSRDNWITRTIRANIKELEKIIKETITNAP